MMISANQYCKCGLVGLFLSAECHSRERQSVLNGVMIPAYYVMIWVTHKNSYQREDGTQMWGETNGAGTLSVIPRFSSDGRGERPWNICVTWSRSPIK